MATVPLRVLYFVSNAFLALVNDSTFFSIKTSSFSISINLVFVSDSDRPFSDSYRLSTVALIADNSSLAEVISFYFTKVFFSLFEIFSSRSLIWIVRVFDVCLAFFAISTKADLLSLSLFNERVSLLI